MTQDLLARGVISPSTSPFGAPVLFVPKEAGLRCVFDYRELNKITIKSRAPIPRIDEILDQFAGSSVFSTLDLIAGYNQFRLHDEDIPATAFSTPTGHYQWLVLSLGMCNAPGAFCRAMTELLGDY